MQCRQALGLALGLLLAGCGKAPEGTRTPEPDATPGASLSRQAEKGPVRLTITATPAKPRLSDLVELTLEASAPPGVELKPPVFGKAVGEFLINGYRELPAKLEGDRTVRSWRYKLEPVQSGRHLIRALGVTFTDRRPDSEARDTAVLLEAAPLEIEVISAAAGQTPDLAALEPVEAPRALPPRPWPWWVWTALAGGVVLLAALAWLVLRRKPAAVPAAPALSPEERAQADLDALARQRYPERGLFAEFYVELTGIVRRYIEARTGIRAPEQTTEEFLRTLRGDARFDPERARQLEQFLAAGDMVKYAAQRPETRDIEAAFEKARAFVAGGRGLLAIPAAAEPAAVGAGEGR